MRIARTPRDRGFVSLQVLAATMVVVVAVSVLLVSGFPERISCEVDRAVTSVTDAGGPGGPECSDDPVTADAAGATVDLLSDNDEDISDEPRPDAFAGGGSTAGGLTGTTFAATDSDASPATRDANAAAVVTATDARCALAPDRGTWESKICVIGDSEDPQDAAKGSDLVVRCATEVTEPTTGTCFPTSDDDVRGGRTAITTAPRDGQTRFCQPLRAERIDPRENNSPFRVDWACASWAGNLYHCTNTLSPDIITTTRSNGLVNYTEPTTWVTDPDFRDTWPEVCDSRTFPAGTLACTPDKATNTAACDIRAFQGLPLRPATCAFFHPTADEDATRSNTLNKAMHCKLTSSGARPGHTVTPPCPAGPRRTLLSETATLGDVLCLPPTDDAIGTLWAAPPGTHLDVEDLLSDSAVELTRVNGAQFVKAQHLLLQRLRQAFGIAFDALPNPVTILHQGPGVWLTGATDHDQPLTVLIVSAAASNQQQHGPFVTWLLDQHGVDASHPLHADLHQLLVDSLVAAETGSGSAPMSSAPFQTATPGQLLANASLLAGGASEDETAGPEVTITFALMVGAAVEGTPGTVVDIAEALHLGVDQITGWVTVEDSAALLIELAALVAAETPLSLDEAHAALGIATPEELGIEQPETIDPLLPEESDDDTGEASSNQPLPPLDVLDLDEDDLPPLVLHPGNNGGAQCFAFALPEDGCRTP